MVRGGLYHTHDSSTSCRLHTRVVLQGGSYHKPCPLALRNLGIAGFTLGRWESRFGTSWAFNSPEIGTGGPRTGFDGSAGSFVAGDPDLRCRGGGEPCSGRETEDGTEFVNAGLISESLELVTLPSLLFEVFRLLGSSAPKASMFPNVPDEG